MKRKNILGGALLALGLMAALGQADQAQAKVTYRVKKGVLTIKGKGNMPSKWRFAQKKTTKNVKKVVVKKGVKSIPEKAFFKMSKVKSIKVAKTVKTIGDRAFGKCVKLKTLEVPGDFTVSNEKIYTLDRGSDEKTVKFNTELDLNTAVHFFSENLKVSEKDKNYKSINGDIYTKDGSTLVCVAGQRENLEFASSCTTFDISSVLYGPYEANCSNLKNIDLPSNVTEVSDDHWYENVCSDPGIQKVTIASKDFSGYGLSILSKKIKCLRDINVLKKNFQGEILEQDGMYYTKDHVLLRMPNQKKNVVPDGIKIIGAGATYEDFDKVEEVVLPEGLEEIGDAAFFYVTKLKTINFPSSLKRIGAYAFSDCYDLNNVTLNQGLEEIDTCAFTCAGVEMLTIPDSVKKVESYIGGVDSNINIVLEGSADGFDKKFAAPWDTVSFNEGIEKSFVSIGGMNHYGKTVVAKWSQVKGASGYELQISKAKKFSKKNIVLKMTKGKDNSSLDKSLKCKYDKLYLRVRPYKKVDGKFVYGKWVKAEFDSLQ